MYVGALKYNEYLKNYYTRMKAKKGAGKAIIATAHKFLGIIYRTLKNNWVFADFPNLVLPRTKTLLRSRQLIIGDLV